MGDLLDRYLRGERPNIGDALSQLLASPGAEQEVVDPRYGDPTFEARKFDSQAQAPIAYAQSRIESAQKSAVTTLQKYGTQLPEEERDRLMRIANGEDVIPEEGLAGKIVSILDTPAEMIRLFIADISGADEKTGFEIEGGDYWKSLFQDEAGVRDNAFQQAMVKFSGDAEKATAAVDALFGADTGSGVLGSMAHTLEAVGWDDDSVASNVARGILGFTADVLLDPLTYVTFGTAGLGKKFALNAAGTAVRSASHEAVERGFRSGAIGAEEFVQDLAKSMVKHADEAKEELINAAVRSRIDDMVGEGWSLDSMGEVEAAVRKSGAIDEDIIAKAEEIGRSRAEDEFLNPIAKLIESKQYKTLEEQFPSFVGYSQTHPAVTGGLKLTTPFGRRTPENYLDVGWRSNRGLTAPVRKLLGNVENQLPHTVRRAMAWMRTRTGAEAPIYGLARRGKFSEWTRASTKATEVMSQLEAAAIAPTIRNTVDALHSSAGANGDEVVGLLMDTLDTPLRDDLIEAQVRELGSEQVWQNFNHTRQAVRTVLSDLYNTYRQFDPRVGHIQDYVPAIQTREFSDLVNLMAERGTAVFPRAPIEDDELRQGLELLSEFVGVAGGRKGVHTEASLGYTRHANARAWDRTVFFPVGEDTSIALLKRDEVSKIIGETEGGNLPREYVNRILSKAMNYIVQKEGVDLGIRRLSDEFSAFETDLGTVLDKYVGGLTEAVRIRALVKELEEVGLVQPRTWGQSVGRTLSAMKHVLDDQSMSQLENIAKAIEKSRADQVAAVSGPKKMTNVKIADGLNMELPEGVVNSTEGQRLVRKLRAIVAPLNGKHNELKGAALQRAQLLEQRGLPKALAGDVAANHEGAVNEATDYLAGVLRTNLRERLAAVAVMLSDDVDGDTAVSVMRQMIDDYAAEQAEVNAAVNALGQRFAETVKVYDNVEPVDLTVAAEGAVETPLAVLGREASKRATEAFDNMRATMHESDRWGDMIAGAEIEKTQLAKVGELTDEPSVGPVGVTPGTVHRPLEIGPTEAPLVPLDQRAQAWERMVQQNAERAAKKARQGESMVENYYRSPQGERQANILDFVESDAVHELNPQLKLALVDAFDNQVTFDRRFVEAARDDLIDTLESSGLTPAQFLGMLPDREAIRFAQEFFGMEWSRLIEQADFQTFKGTVPIEQLHFNLMSARPRMASYRGGTPQPFVETWTWEKLRHMNPQALHDPFFTSEMMTTLWVAAHEQLARKGHGIAAQAFSTKTVKELRKLASEAGVAGRSKMKKAELVEALAGRQDTITTADDAMAELQQKMGMYQKAYITASRNKGLGSVFDSRGQAIQGANLMAAMVRGDMNVLLAPGNEAGVRRVFKLLGLDQERVRFRRGPNGTGSITYHPPRTRSMEITPQSALKEVAASFNLTGLPPTQVWRTIKDMPPAILGNAGDLVRAFGEEPQEWIEYLALADKQWSMRLVPGSTAEQDRLMSSLLDAIQDPNTGDAYITKLWEDTRDKLADSLPADDMERLEALIGLKTVPDELRAGAQAWFDEWFQAARIPTEDVVRRLDEMAETVLHSVPEVSDEHKEALAAISEFQRRWADIGVEHGARRNSETYARSVQDAYSIGIGERESGRLTSAAESTVGAARRAFERAEKAAATLPDLSLRTQARDLMATKARQLEDVTDDIIKGGRIPVQEIDKFADPSSRVLAVAGLDKKIADRDVLGVLDTIVGNIQGLYTPEGVTLLAKHARGAMNWWKVMATISRPTFNIRNFIGAVWNNLIGDVGMREYGMVGANLLRYRKAIRRGATPIEALDAVHPAFKPYLRAMMDHGVLGTEFSATLPSQVQRGLKDISPNLLSAKHSPLVRVGAWGMQSVEDFHRAAAFVKAFDPKRPETAVTAKTLAETLHFDYRNLTSLERAATTFIPFFVWTRRNLPLQMRMVLEKPSVLTKYQHLVKNAEASLGGEDSNIFDDMYLPFGTSSLALVTDVILDENTPFAQRLIIDPQLPVGDLETFLNEVNFSPISWFKWLSSSVAPWFTMPQEVVAAEEYGYVNAPAGISEIVEGLMKIGLFDDRTTQSGDAQISYGMRQLIETLMPWHRETIGAVFPTDPKRAQRLGVPQEDADFSLEGILATLGGGVGIKRQVAEDQLGEAYEAGEEVRDITSVANLQGVMPVEEEPFVRPTELPGVRS